VAQRACGCRRTIRRNARHAHPRSALRRRVFYLYQDDDFEAITRSRPIQHWNLIPHHEDEGQLLLAGCIFPWHAQRGGRPLPDAVDQRRADRGFQSAWFYLAQVWYARGIWTRPNRPCARSGKCRLSSGQKDHLFANVLMYQGKFDEPSGCCDLERARPLRPPMQGSTSEFALVRPEKAADADPS